MLMRGLVGSICVLGIIRGRNMCCCEDDRYYQQQRYNGGGYGNSPYQQMGGGYGAPMQQIIMRQPAPTSPQEAELLRMFENLSTGNNCQIFADIWSLFLFSVSQMCAQAQMSYRQAGAMENQAAYDNQNAQGMAMFDGGGMFEMMEQNQRDNDMQQANMLANQGSQVLQAAFARIPVGCAERMRYPQYMAEIGLVPVPMLGGGKS